MVDGGSGGGPKIAYPLRTRVGTNRFAYFRVSDSPRTVLQALCNCPLELECPTQTPPSVSSSSHTAQTNCEENTTRASARPCIVWRMSPSTIRSA